MFKVIITTIVATLFLCSVGSAQVLFSPSGSTYIDDNLAIQWSIGEPLISTYTIQDEYVITQGFNQPLVICDPCTEDLYQDSFSTADIKQQGENILVFPNPVGDQLNIQTSIKMSDQGYIAILDGNARVFRIEAISESTDISRKTINVQDYQPGRYYLKIFNGVYSETTGFLKF